MRSKRGYRGLVLAWAMLIWAVLGASGARAQENVDAPAEIELSGEGAGEEGSPPEVAREADPTEPWTGTYAEGMAEIVRLAASEEHAEALALTERLLAPDRYARLRARLEEKLGPRGATWLAPLDASLAWIGLESLDDRSRAEVRYVRGLLHARTGAVLQADEELGLARALAGPGVTRNDAVYALGSLDLALAEELRQRIPEISGAAPGAPAAPGSPPGGGEEEPDPLELARSAYLEARAHLVERLRLDWRDANTRANTELVQRRLRELDEIERQREEQQEQQGEDGQPQPSDDQDSESEDSEDQESQDQESQDQESQDQESESEESETPDSESDPQEQDESEDAESEAEDAEQESEASPEERVLTQEEMMRLLEEFQRYQEQGSELREQNRRVRRENVDKDW